jgi:hypothetical protein
MKKLKLLAVAVSLAVLVGGGLYFNRGIASDSGEKTAELRPADCPLYPVSPGLFVANPDSYFEGLSKYTTELGSRVARNPVTLQVTRNNFIDDYLFDKMEGDGVASSGLCTDDEFIRRVWLDLTGRIPSAEDVRRFLSDTTPNKRDRLVDTLLASDAFVDRMTLFFNELFQNSRSRLGSGTDVYHMYIRNFVQQNRPYHEVVQELLTATGDTYQNGPANFLASAFNPEANQADIFDDMGIQADRIFLGIQNLCVSCHNGARHLEETNLWLAARLREETWGMSAFFSGLRWSRERVGGETRTIFTEVDSIGYNTQMGGGYRPQRRGSRPIISPKYILGDQAISPERNYRAELARFITADPQFAKATVNYLWKTFMGLGIVDPPNSFDLSRQDPDNPPPAPWSVQPSHPDLLAALAEEFQASNFDIRHVIELIAKSNAYQLSASYNGQWQDSYARYFARHILRRLSPEQMHDSIASATQVVPGYNLRIGYVNWATQFTESGTLGPFGVFEPGNRVDIERPDPPRGSISQVLTLMNNGNFILPRIKNGTVSVVQPSGQPSVNRNTLVKTLLANRDMSNEQIIDELFLATLSRYPDDREKTLAMEKLEPDRVRGTEDLHWVLLNKLDFLFY